MKEKMKPYYLGLDLGTDSVGWAVTDENYKLFRHQGKSLWGVRLFSQANTAATRRQHRGARRRLERRKERLQLLQSLFAPIINPIDGSFFVRLEESNLYQEDKSSKIRFSLFADKQFNDADFHRTYPTIYHLRQSLLTAVDPDPRLVYLAFHHMIKYRGHFLIEGETLKQVDDIEPPLSAINQYLSENDMPTLDVSDYSSIQESLCLSKSSQRKSALLKVFEVDDNKIKALVGLISGGSVGSNKIFTDIEKEDQIKIDFNDDWDTKESELQERLGEKFFLIQKAKLLFDYGVLKRLLGKERFISAGMVAKYNKHKNGLALLKSVIRKYIPDQYDAMFGAPQNEKCNYTAYSGKYDFGPRGTKPVGEKIKKSDQEAFYKYVKQVLNESREAMKDAGVAAILEDIDSGVFMPKQVGKSNAVLPYQCNFVELQAILSNLERYPRYAFLSNKDQNGVSVKDKIASLLKFRMPYYVGPVNNHSGKYWVVRRNDGKIYPWNLEEKVDLEETEQRFIERMTKDCPYVPNAKVLPKNSLLYEEASLLNLINKIRINGEVLSVPIKNALSQYFSTPLPNGNVVAKMSKAAIKKWMVAQGYISSNESREISIDGIDEEITANRRTYAQLCKIMGGADMVERYRDELETVILWATIAGPEKSNLRARLKRFSKEKGNFLSNDQIKRIGGLTLNGWGRYSKELLCNRYGTDLDTGEIMQVSVIEMLRNTNCNLSELLNDETYGFSNALDSLRESGNGSVNYATIDALYCSPSVKKQIWQAVQVVNEIKKVVGERPLKIFVEMARGDSKEEAAKRENNRCVERKNMLSKALEKLSQERDGSIIDELENFSKKDFQKKKLFLYFMQNGVDAYTGERIDYARLKDYDIDHIYPRSKIKDDSIHDNLVLTYHEQNLKKEDVFPVSPEVQKKMIDRWKSWLNYNLITKEKFNRLTRTMPLSAQECAEFINRQLVETRQSTKEVCRLLKQIFPDSEIVYSKASLVSEFRQGVEYAKNEKASFVKVRDINDLHHAKDAYLNIVVGNVYNTVFGHDARVYFAKENVDHVSLTKLYMRTAPKAWIPGKEGTIVQVQKTMANNAILFTRESKVQKGELFNATIAQKGKEELVPLKSGQSGKYAIMGDTFKYGGYNSEKRTHFMLVQHRKNGKECYTLLGVVARLASTLSDDATRIEYCKKLGFVDPIVLIPKIKVDTMFEFDGALVTLSGMTGKRIVWKLAMQHGYTVQEERYLKKVTNVVLKGKENKEYKLDATDGITKQENLAIYDRLIEILSEPRYQALLPLRSYTEKLQSCRETFSELDELKQCNVLMEILAEIKCDAQASDFSALGEGKKVGVLAVSNTFDCLRGKFIVHRSVTGIFERKIPLSDFAVKRT